MRMTVAYDGRGFAGFAVQPGQVTVGGALSDALARVLRAPVSLTVAGRTDAGVHAQGQVVSFDVPRDHLDAEKLPAALNRRLAPAIVVHDAAEAPPGFDARRSALSRRYRYTVLNRAAPDPFLDATSWHVSEPLDLAAMRLACDPIIGEHDFSSFCRVPRRTPGAGMTRRVLDAAWSDEGDGRLCFDVESTSFCHQMVRSVVGLMVTMGAGRRRAGEMAGVLRARDRGMAGPLAPARGLCLMEVRYPPPFSELGAVKGP